MSPTSDANAAGMPGGVRLPAVNEPASRLEILRELRSLHQQSTVFWERFDTARFFAPLGEAWSPADNVRHLIKSCRPVAGALRVPKILLIVPGAGVSRRGSRSYTELRDDYLAALAGGVQAGRFAPARQKVEGDLDSARRELMARRESVAVNLHAAVEAWGDRGLDRLRMPHPALGQLTVREMLLFTLYHNLHHVLNVARRVGWRE
jgi:DinB family protein